MSELHAVLPLHLPLGLEAAPQHERCYDCPVIQIKKKEKQIMKTTLPAKQMLLLGAVSTALGCGIGDNFVAGLGNGGTRFGQSAISELAEELASNEVVAPVTDEMLRASFDAIVARAAQGDADAALVLFRVADAQRKAEEEE